MRRLRILTSAAVLLAALLLLGCGEGAGAEATGDDGRVSSTRRTTLPTTAASIK